MPPLDIPVIPRISLTARNVYVVNGGQTAPSSSLIGLFNPINGLFSAFSATVVKVRFMVQCMYTCRLFRGLVKLQDGWKARRRVDNRSGCGTVPRQGVDCQISITVVVRINKKAYVLIRNIVNVRKHTRRIRKTVVIHGNKELTKRMEDGSAEISITLRRTVVRGVIPSRMRTLVCLLISRLNWTPSSIPCWQSRFPSKDSPT